MVEMKRNTKRNQQESWTMSESMKSYWWSHPCEVGIFNFGDCMRYLSDCYFNGYAGYRTIKKEESLQKGKEWLEKATAAELVASNMPEEKTAEDNWVF